MLIVGERINATRLAIKNALQERNAAAIKGEARRQAEAGADYLDVNGGSTPAEELDNMLWLCDVVQAEVDLPLCLDSASAEVLAAGLARSRNGRPMVNSITLEAGRHERILPLVKEHRARVVALPLSDSGIPRTAADRLRGVERIVVEVTRLGIPLEDVYIDPMVMALGSDGSAGLVLMETLRGIKKGWPELRTTVGLSNVSFGLPNRRLLNRTFLAMLMGLGLDAAIVDPLDPQIMATAAAGVALLGRDEDCMEYLKAYRAKKLSV
jgi:5-methyltetrahydrofolate--homocysteine methyltransferase